ncbi:MAG: hypothetical protein ACFFD4_08930 [Candidatus Odinarchaeota archaeon]
MSYEMKSAILTGALARKDAEAFDWLMTKPFFNILEVRDAIRTIYELKDKLKDTRYKVGYSSGPRKMVKRWFKRLTADELTRSLVKYSYPAWREVIDMTHPKPDNFQVEWFQQAVYGGQVPEDAELARLRKFKHADKEEQAEIIKSSGVHSYHYFQREVLADKELGTEQAKVMALPQLIRFHQRFNDIAIDEILLERLKQQEKPLHVNFAEYMSFIQILRGANYTDKKIQKTRQAIAGELERLADLGIEHQKINLDYPVALLVDRSGSMHQAISIGVPLAAILASRNPTDTKLVFFDDTAFEKPPPRKMKEVLEYVKSIHSGGSTSPAAALMSVYNKGIKPKTLVVITDEGENIPVNYKNRQYNFSALLRELYGNDLPRIIFITIGTSDQMTAGKGQSWYANQETLSKLGIPYERFEIDPKQIDFSFVESLLAMVRHSKTLIQQIQEEMVAKKLQENKEKSGSMVLVEVEKEIKKQGPSMFALGVAITTLSDLAMLRMENKLQFIKELYKIKVLADTLKLPELANEVEKARHGITRLKTMGESEFDDILEKAAKWSAMLEYG